MRLSGSSSSYMDAASLNLFLSFSLSNISPRLVPHSVCLRLSSCTLIGAVSLYDPSIKRITYVPQFRGFQIPWNSSMLHLNHLVDEGTRGRGVRGDEARSKMEFSLGEKRTRKTKTTNEKHVQYVKSFYTHKSTCTHKCTNPHSPTNTPKPFSTYRVRKSRMVSPWVTIT